MATPKTQTIFVAGLGMVGIGFLERLLELDETTRHYKIITCGEETSLAYNRVALTEYFQHRSVDKLFLQPPEWYAQQDPERFVFHTGEQVVHVDHAAHTVRTSKDREIQYDVCVLATGSEASLPSYVKPEQAKAPGVFVYRNISDLDALLAYSEQPGIKGGRAVVVGGGLLGLEAAKAVYELDSIPSVTILNRQAYPLSRQLDADAGELVLHRIEALGVQVLTGVSVARMVLDDETGAFRGFEFDDGSVLDAQLVIYAVGITPRDDLARKSGIDCIARGGIIVNDSLETSAKDVYAIGECASWRGNTYGLIAPGIEMADILSFNLTQTSTTLGSFKPRVMNDPDLSTKLKLMGVDVASFGDFFADKRMKERERQAKVKERQNSVTLPNRPSIPSESVTTPTDPKANSTHVDAPIIEPATTTSETVGKKRVHRTADERREDPIKCLTYKDPFSSVYKKFIFSADGKYLVGGMMVGDVRDYVKLVAIVKKKKPLDKPPHEFIMGKSAASGEDDGADLDDDTQVCSCHNVTKGSIGKAVKEGVDNMADLKRITKAGTGCGGCIPLVTNIFKAELKKAGVETNNNICPHFAMSRVELFNVIKIKQLKDFPTIMTTIGIKPDAIGCELCKPAVASCLSSLWNEPVMKPIHNQNQETNDKYLANIQRNGTFSVIPRISAGEITPDGLIAIGQVAKKYALYTKITGGQRIDMFGAQKQDLPSIWAELVEAGFQSGHAYGKSLRTVKSCVGTTWCRYGVGDSVGLAVQLEERYKSVRSPHKIKGGVSGCVRECAEAQSKDFGLIATDKGWNLFIGGNGGANPRHAVLFAKDVPPSKVVRLIDRYLMFYIRTADKLARTARWMESFEGGVERLKQILIDDALGVCDDLEKEMDALVGTYACEWTEVVKNPERQKQFRQFVNTDETVTNIETIVERGQSRPADWPKDFPGVKIGDHDVPTPRDEWEWKPLAKVSDLAPAETHTTSAAVKYGDTQLAIFHVPRKGYFATQQMCPHRRAFVLDHGIIGDDAQGNPYVSCPLHKRNYRLDTGSCTNDSEFSILSFDVKEEDNFLLVKLPSQDELDGAIGTTKWMVRGATAEAYGRGGGTQIEIVGPDGQIKSEEKAKLEVVLDGEAGEAEAGHSCDSGEGGAGCGNKALEW